MDIANDEPFTIFWAQVGLHELMQKLNTGNNAPFHFFLMHFWVKLFGINPFSVRFLSLIFSSVTPVFIFLIGKRFYNYFTGILAAFIFTFATIHVYFSHEARVYSLLALLTAISLYLFLRIIENPKNRKLFIFLFIVNLLLIYSHYFGFFIPFIEVISVLFIKERKSLIKPITLLMSFLAISFLPIFFIFIERFSSSTNNGTWVSGPEFGQVYGFLNIFINNRINMLLLILIFITGFIIVLKQKYFKKTFDDLFNTKTVIIFLWFFVPYIIMFLISYKVPMFIDRYILYTSIPFYIFIAILVNSVFQNYRFKIIAAVIFLGSMVFTFSLNPDNFRNMKEIVALVKRLKTKNTEVFIAPDYADLGFVYHYNIDYFKDYKNYKQLMKSENIFPVSNEAEAASVLDTTLNKCIYIQAGSEFQDPDNKIYNFLSSKYKKVEHHKVFQVYLVHDFSN